MFLLLNDRKDDNYPRTKVDPLGTPFKVRTLVTRAVKLSKAVLPLRMKASRDLTESMSLELKIHSRETKQLLLVHSQVT